MNRQYAKWVTTALCLLLVGCSFMREAMEGQQDVVAEVGGYTLTIDQAVELLRTGSAETVPARVSVVDRLTSFWVAYTVLAKELASPDTFSDLDLAPMMRLGLDQDVVWQLREDRILPRATPTDNEIVESYTREQPFTRVEAQQILIRVPETAAPEQQDSLRRFSESLRQRILAGEDFAELARRHSNDPATAAKGGDLGWIDRGRLMSDLETVVFQLHPGELSETVRTRLGYHIIKVRDRQEPEFDSVRDDYRDELMMRQLPGLEGAYIDSLFAAADFRMAPGATLLVKELATSQGLERLTPARRMGLLAKYRGGELTVGEWADFVMIGAPNARNAFAGADSVTVETWLREMVRNELLTKAARDLGYTLSQTKADSIKQIAVRELLATAALARFRRDDFLRGDETIPDAVDRVIRELFRRQRSPQAIDRVAAALWREPTIRVYPSRYPAVVEGLVRTRQLPGEAPDASKPPAEPGS